MSARKSWQADSLNELVGEDVIGVDPKSRVKEHHGILLEITEEGHMKLVPNTAKDATESITIEDPESFKWYNYNDYKKRERAMTHVYDSWK